MDTKDFVRELEQSNERLLAVLRCPLAIQLSEKMNVKVLLKMALKNEMEATELAAFWLPTTAELDVKLGFARQAGDEARHYRLIEDRLRELGEDMTGFQPFAAGRSPLFQYLSALSGTAERIAAGQFTREAIALIKNEQFIEFCRGAGDAATARLYEEVIQPDETFHHRLGKTLLEKYALTEEAQEKARRAAEKTLELAEELQEIALAKMGVHHAPGC